MGKLKISSFIGLLLVLITSNAIAALKGNEVELDGKTYLVSNDQVYLLETVPEETRQRVLDTQLKEIRDMNAREYSDYLFPEERERIEKEAWDEVQWQEGNELTPELLQKIIEIVMKYHKGRD